MNLEILHQYRDDILKLAGQYHSANVRVFGSVARGEATETSDVDFIIDRTPEQDLFDFIRLARALEELLGCKVDVVHSTALHHSIREQVLQEAIAL
ncbi:MAG: nucleotidyltransferase family protein [Hormoscilla sp. GM7CHS1pb]|nr:nucleotidyltransferase family protein [Hormoscilla sp. GM7CHS1pb]